MRRIFAVHGATVSHLVMKPTRGQHSDRGSGARDQGADHPPWMPLSSFASGAPLWFDYFLLSSFTFSAAPDA